ncbi:MAG TPA: acylphosphatase [Fervidobacterium sp.]|nr:acylphosphatase [Fervidobacterium sp.]HOL03804.1 acylphosphatase [Fervidobacterium sp.]HON04207.1 acylphosphatase [Fervidobacterium sp.]HPC79280.1 acylphosphatase [Fervidobacterium sp.]HRB91431.1 acylphosphatase [Fervidobacterium sp.]
MEVIWKEWNITGIVQGVGFRYFVKNVARAIGVRGYVRNEDDGSVTVVAGGNEAQLQELLKKIMEGNGWSYIYNIDEKNLPPQEYKSFDVEY